MTKFLASGAMDNWPT